MNELQSQNPADCEIAYETALWLLYAILDDTESNGPRNTGEGKGDEEEEQDRETVLAFVESVEKRLKALRRKFA